MKKIITLIFSIILITVVSCQSTEGIDRNTDNSNIIADSTPCNPNSSDDTKAILEYIAGLSTDYLNGTIAGQNCRHGNQITSDHSDDAYKNLVSDLHTETGQWIGMIGLDYEHDKIFTTAELTAANNVLISHWNKGGLITINWAPHNPWINDESDIENNPGEWHHTRTNSVDYNGSVVNLNDLINPEREIHTIWRKKLDRIAAALSELQDAGVVVLWRPLQEMNGNWFWWGIANYPNNPDPYINLYRDMYDYFTNTKGLNNLLWVYSPNAGADTTWIRPVDFRYPGDDYVDIVAGTAYGNNLNIADYQIYVQLGKPIGMGEYGMTAESDYSLNGTFDNRNYLNRIRSNYPRVAYFVIWHNWDWGNGTSANMAIINNEYSNEMMNDEGILTIDRFNWK